jgi:outer membrane protein, multidrug efflux system
MCFSRAVAGQCGMGRLTAYVLMVLALSGCRIPSLCKPDPAPDLPQNFNGAASSENSADVGIVEFFDDPVLTQLLTEGLAQNQELKIRNQQVRVAWNEIMARRGAYFPFVTLGARGGFEKSSRYTPMGAAEDQLTFPGGGRFPDPLPDTQLSANLFWHVDIWRQFRNSRAAANERYIEAAESWNFLVTRLVAETAENYYELAALDKRLVYLNQTIELQEQSLEAAKAFQAAGRGTELPVQRFLAEVRKNESQRQIIRQRTIEVENRINFLVGRFPQPVERASWDFIKLDSSILNVGVPAQLLQNRRDIRAAERELTASGLDVAVARARFFPTLDITAGIGFQAFSPKYLFKPEALIANAAGELVAPLINKAAIRAEYLSANARQLEAVYNYQRTVINAFTEVVNSLAKAQNYRQSVEIKQEQVKALEKSVTIAQELFNKPLPEAFARVEYVDVLLATRDLLEARTVLIETKQQQLSAIVNAYQALGGGTLVSSSGVEFADLFCAPSTHDEILIPVPNAVEPPVPELLPSFPGTPPPRREF